MEEILNQYNLEYTIDDSFIELWRNGRTTKINLPIDDISLTILLDLFCVYSPESTVQLKEKFPFFFEKPEPGETICVKQIGKDIPDSYQIGTFLKFQNDKIICFDENQEKEIECDFYAKFDGVNHPSTSFWHNAKQNHVTYAVMEKELL